MISSMIRGVLFSLIFVLASRGVAETPQAKSFEEHFREGLAAYQTKAYDKALESFTQALVLEPGNTAAMTDAALAAFQLDKKGLAIAWFRRALALEPDLPEARDGLRFALTKLDVKEIPHRLETYETVRADVLVLAPARVFLALTALLLFASLWLLLGWLGARKRAHRAQEVTPPFRLSIAILGALASAGVILTAMKLYDSMLPRGTILGKTVDVLSAPAASGVSLFQLHEGFEVLIQDVNDEWVQVTYPGGLTGWIPKKEILSTDISGI